MTDEFDKMVATINLQKGEIVGINTMLLAMAKCLPPALLSRLLDEFNRELEIAKSDLSYRAIPDEVISGLEDYGQMWNGFWSDTPPV